MTRLEAQRVRARDLEVALRALEVATDAVGAHSGQERPQDYLRAAARQAYSAAMILSEMANHFDKENVR